jgi:GT2 family glycosyltransferase
MFLGAARICHTPGAARRLAPSGRAAVAAINVHWAMILSTPEALESLEISVVIVNHNGGGFLRDAVTALQENTVCRSAEIIIVDSASTDGSSEKLPPGRLPVRIIRCEENVGFCTGNNLGVSAARGRLVAFTQPDGTVEAGWDQGLREAIVPPEVAAVGGIVLKVRRGWPGHGRPGSAPGRAPKRAPGVGEPEAGDRIDSAGIAIAPNFAGWSLCENLTPEQAGLRAGEHRDVVGLSPAFLMVRRADHLRIGGFWEELWMYGDEPDYAVRLACLGRSLVCPESRMRHHVGASAGAYQSPLRLYWSSRNRLLGAARHLPLPQLVFAIVLSIVFDGVQLLQQRQPVAGAAILKGWLSGLRGIRAARRLSTPTERTDAASRLASLRQTVAQQRLLGRVSVRRHE